MKVAICIPDFRHIIEYAPRDFVHLVHKWSGGMILIDHEEPSGDTAFNLHKTEVLFIFEL